MGSRCLASLATLLAILSAASAQPYSRKGSGSTDSIEERMALYTTWAKANSERGRRLFDYYGPTPAPPGPTPSPTPGPYGPPTPTPTPPTPEPTPSTPTPTPPTPEPTPSTPTPTPPTPESTPPTPTPTPPTPKPTPPTVKPPKGPSPAKPPKSGKIPIVVQPPDGFSCVWNQSDYVEKKVVAYWTGYANLTAVRNKVFKNTDSFLECKDACDQDPACAGWTRIAAGDKLNNKKCFLIDDLTVLDPSPARTSLNHAGPDRDEDKFPELRYVDDSVPLLCESGTKDWWYPKDYYGCPYKSKGHP